MKITDKIHQLKIDFFVPISPEKSLSRFVNSLIIFGDTITIIDSGVKDSYKNIYDYIEKNNRKICEIKTLIISHSHPDHIGSASKIKADTGCKVIGHTLEKDWIENIDQQFASRPVPGFYGLVNQPVKLDYILKGGEFLKLDNDVTVEIINTPGHSKGSFSILFSGEVLFTADSLPLVNDIPTYDNFKDLKKSLELIKTITNYKTLLTSWTSPVNNREEIVQLINNGEEYLNRIDAVIKNIYANGRDTMINCRQAIDALGLPAFFAIPLVDRAFKTH